jgi:hypothetical protein
VLEEHVADEDVVFSAPSALVPEVS